jgi:hypothetical protein
VCTKAGRSSQGTLHLTAHHLIFHHDDQEREEMWVSSLIVLSVHAQLSAYATAGPIPIDLARDPPTADIAWAVPAQRTDADV